MIVWITEKLSQKIHVWICMLHVSKKSSVSKVKQRINSPSFSKMSTVPKFVAVSNVCAALVA